MGVTAAVILICTVVARRTSASAAQATTLMRVGGWTRRRLRVLSVIEVSGIAVVAVAVTAILVLLAPADISPLTEFGNLRAIAVLICFLAVPIAAIATARARGVSAAFSTEKRRPC